MKRVIANSNGVTPQTSFFSTFSQGFVGSEGPELIEPLPIGPAPCAQQYGPSDE